MRMTKPAARYSSSDGSATSRIFRTFGAEDADGVLDRPEHGGISAVVGLMEVAHDADAKALGALVQVGGEVGHWPVGGGGVLRIVAGHRLQQHRTVLRRPSHRAGVVEGEGE